MLLQSFSLWPCCQSLLHVFVFALFVVSVVLCICTVARLMKMCWCFIILCVLISPTLSTRSFTDITTLSKIISTYKAVPGCLSIERTCQRTETTEHNSKKHGVKFRLRLSGVTKSSTIYNPLIHLVVSHICACAC